MYLPANRLVCHFLPTHPDLFVSATAHYTNIFLSKRLYVLAWLIAVVVRIYARVILTAADEEALTSSLVLRNQVHLGSTPAKHPLGQTHDGESPVAQQQYWRLGPRRLVPHVEGTTMGFASATGWGMAATPNARHAMTVKTENCILA